MAKTTRQLLADAHQRIRDLENEKHALQSQHIPLEMQISGLRFANGELAKSLQELGAMRIAEANRLSDAELYALAAVVHTEAMTGTEARERLCAELGLRGILTLASGKKAGA